MLAFYGIPFAFFQIPQSFALDISGCKVRDRLRIGYIRRLMLRKTEIVEQMERYSENKKKELSEKRRELD